MPRSRLGPLAIESKLGDHPSRSSVWRAVHVQLQRAVAVKVFSVPFGATPEARAQLADEWEELKKLKHPAIVNCYGGGFEETDAYLAHELLEGETLSSQLQRRTRLPWESVLDLAEPMINAIEYLHGRQIVHGQLQPDKIIISGLSPVLIDIRTARTRSPFQSGRPATREEVALRAPEQIEDPNTLAASVDLYAYGAILYLAVTGRLPVEGQTEAELKSNILTQPPPSVASIVMDCPVWLDRLIMQLLEKNPAARPHSAQAVQLGIAEVRRRAMSRAGVAEHASAGFSPLNVTDQKERNEARALLGQAALDADKQVTADATPWHEKPWVLISALLVLVGVITYFVWPLNEDQMRQRAEELLAQDTRSALNQAKISYLQPMLVRFPEGKHRQWVQEQIDRVEMVQAEHTLDVKLKRNLKLTSEGERLFAEARRFERFGDQATALDKYRSMETLLGDDAQYRPYVNLARRQTAAIENNEQQQNEAATIIQAKLDEAEQLIASGKVIAARKIWYSVIDLYGENENVAPLVARAQDNLAGSGFQGESASQP
ncbi:MAG: serine/threonine protein kinase [Pirellulales bacterium]|nr:serine/threonine protein kinase [Pirellulales bacterium]